MALNFTKTRTELVFFIRRHLSAFEIFEVSPEEVRVFLLRAKPDWFMFEDDVKSMFPAL